MRNLNPKELADFTAITLRWLILAGLGLGFSLSDGGNPAVRNILLAGALWNSVLAFLPLLNRRFPYLRILQVLVDFLVANLLFFSLLNRPDGVIWSGLLPVVSAAILFDLRVAFLAVLLTVLSIGLQFTVFARQETSLGFIVIPALIFSAIALILHFANRAVLERHEKSRRDLVKTAQEAEKSLEDAKRVYAKVAEAVNKDLDEARILNSMVNLSDQLLAFGNDSAGNLVTAVLLRKGTEPEGCRYQVAASHRFLTTDEETNLNLSGGVIQRSLEERQPRLSKDMTKDPELLRLASLRSSRSVYSIPIFGREDRDPLGVYLLAHPDENFFTPERRDVLEKITRLSGLALQNARRYQNLDSDRERLVEIIQDHRNRLMRELHDGSTQSVSALALRANLIRRMFERDGVISVEELQKMEDLARSTAKELREVLFTLRPLEKKPDGLITSLENMAAHHRSLENRSVTVDVDPDLVASLEPKVQAILFYLAEEAIELARRYAVHEPVGIRVKAEAGDLAGLEVEIPLNHSGDVENVHNGRNSLGIANLRELSALVNGDVSVEAVEGQGIRIRCWVPVTREAAERLRERS